MSKTDLQQRIRERTLEAGFDVVGFASPEIKREAGERLMNFLKQGYHGDMGWLAAKADRRVSPRALWPEVGTVIVVGANYGPDHDPLERLETARVAGQGNISVYARNDDYHDLMKKRLKSVGRWICETFDCDVKVFVDTALFSKSPLHKQQALVGKANIPISSRGNSALGSSWARYTQRWISSPMRPCQITAAVVGSVSMFVRPMRLTARTD